jgi:hypothetical protein
MLRLIEILASVFTEGADVSRAQLRHITARQRRGQKRRGYKRKPPYQLVYGHHHDQARREEGNNSGYAENAQSFHEETVQAQRRAEGVDHTMAANRILRPHLLQHPIIRHYWWIAIQSVHGLNFAP